MINERRANMVQDIPEISHLVNWKRKTTGYFSVRAHLREKPSLKQGGKYGKESPHA